MNLFTQARRALKFEVSLELATPLLLRSGQTGDVTDSSIERTFDNRLHINGYVWASLLRRALARLADGRELAGLVGKFQENGSLSPLWCEASIEDLHATTVNPGIAIDREYGATRSGALFNDELGLAGLPLTLRFTLFAEDDVTAQRWRAALLGALRLIDDGIENIGGGWTYGYGRLSVGRIRSVTLDLKPEDRTEQEVRRAREARKQLWQWDKIEWGPDEKIPETVTCTTPATIIDVAARVAPGQLLAVKSQVFPIDAPRFGKLPDSFVFRRNRLIGDKTVHEPVIPGKAIRQAILSVPLERKWRSARKEGEPDICLSTTHVKRCPKEKPCSCRRCTWFGSTDAAGIIAVTDAPVTNYAMEVISRIQLCEHSLQNMNLFCGEYLKAGDFSFKIIIDNGRAGNADELVKEICDLLEEMKDKTSLPEEEKGITAPPGWYRLGGTATCTGQVQVNDYTIRGGAQL